MTPKKTSKRGDRRARQNKNSGPSIDMDKQNARLGDSTNDSLTWNTTSEAVPRFGRSSRFDNAIHRIIQSNNIGTILTGSNTLPTFAALAFDTGNLLTQFSQLAAVFDQYWIKEIEVWFQPAYGSVNSNIQPGQAQFYSAIDYDDAAVWTSLSQPLQYENVIVTSFNNGHYRKFRPHMAVGAYSGSAFTQFQNVPSTWCDSASTSLKHYGCKVALDTLGTGNTLTIQVIVRSTVYFRNIF